MADPAPRRDPFADALEQWRLDVLKEAEAAAERKVREILATQAANAQERLLKTDEAASMLGMSPGALRQLVARGNIVPDLRGQRGDGGLKGNRFSMRTINAFIARRGRRGQE